MSKPLPKLGKVGLGLGQKIMCGLALTKEELESARKKSRMESLEIDLSGGGKHAIGTQKTPPDSPKSHDSGSP